MTVRVEALPDPLRAPPERDGAGQDHEKIGAKAFDLLADGVIGALADIDHRDQSGDPDKYAQHRQHGPHLIAKDRLHRGGRDHHPECQRTRQLGGAVDGAGQEPA